MDTSQQHRPHLRIASRGKTHTPAYCWMAIWHSFSSSSEMTNPESRGSDWWWTLPRQLRDDEGDDLLRTSVSPWDWPNPFTTVMIREDRLVQNLSLDAFSVSNQYKTLNRLHPYFVHPSVTPVTSALRHQYLAEPACKLKLKQMIGSNGFTENCLSYWLEHGTFCKLLYLQATLSKTVHWIVTAQK